MIPLFIGMMAPGWKIYVGDEDYSAVIYSMLSMLFTSGPEI